MNKVLLAGQCSPTDLDGLRTLYSFIACTMKEKGVIDLQSFFSIMWTAASPACFGDLLL